MKIINLSILFLFQHSVFATVLDNGTIKNFCEAYSNSAALQIYHAIENQHYNGEDGIYKSVTELQKHFNGNSLYRNYADDNRNSIAEDLIKLLRQENGVFPKTINTSEQISAYAQDYYKGNKLYNLKDSEEANQIISTLNNLLENLKSKKGFIDKDQFRNEYKAQFYVDSSGVFGYPTLDNLFEKDQALEILEIPGSKFKMSSTLKHGDEKYSVDFVTLTDPLGVETNYESVATMILKTIPVCSQYYDFETKMDDFFGANIVHAKLKPSIDAAAQIRDEETKSKVEFLQTQLKKAKSVLENPDAIGF